MIRSNNYSIAAKAARLEDLDELVGLSYEMPPWPKSVAALNKLRRRYVIAPLSNGHVALPVHMAGAAGLPWDAVFGADIFRHYKPAPETYSSQVLVGRTGLLGDKNQYLKDCAVNSTGNNTLGDPSGVLVVDETGSPGAEGLLQ